MSDSNFYIWNSKNKLYRLALQQDKTGLIEKHINKDVKNGIQSLYQDIEMVKYLLDQ